MNPQDPIRFTKEELEIEGGRTLILYEFGIALEPPVEEEGPPVNEPQR